MSEHEIERLTSTNSNASTSSSGPRRFKTQLVDEMISEFDNLGIKVGNGILEKKTDPGFIGERIKVMTNAYSMTMYQIPVYRYDVTISGYHKNGKLVEFTKRAKDDFVVVNRKNLCRTIFQCIIQKYIDFFGNDPFKLFYDLQSILYSLIIFKSNEKIFELDSSDCNKIIELKYYDCIKILIKKVINGFELTLGDLSALSNDTLNQNHSLQHFIELAVNQAVLFNPCEHMTLNDGTSFLMNPSEFEFNVDDGPYLNKKKTKYLGLGAHKSVRYIEGPMGRNNQLPSLIVNIKKTPFHQINITLFDKACDILNLDYKIINLHHHNFTGADVNKLSKLFRGIYVEVRHGHARSLRISGVSEWTPLTYYIENNQQKIRLCDYYDDKYGIKLNYLKAPLATVNERNKINYFPLELCFVQDFQRVSVNQMSSNETIQMIKACAIPPNQLKEQIQKTVKSIHLTDSMYLKSAGIKIFNEPLITDGRILKPPRIQFNSKIIKPNLDGKFFSTDNFFSRSECKKWEINLIPGRSTAFTQIIFDNFVDQYVQCCRQHGMIMENPIRKNTIRSTIIEVDNIIKNCKNENYDFVMFITEDKITNLHDVIKSCEQKYQIVTQDLKLSNAYQIGLKKKSENLRNIVAKTNEKLGGLNYLLTLSDQYIHSLISSETLIIGIGVSHSSPVSEYKRLRESQVIAPSVVGFAANIRENPFDFIGDFVYNEPRRDEKVSIIQSIVQNCIIRFNCIRNEYPKRVIIYKNGISETQYSMTLQYEIPLIRNAFKVLNIDCKLTVLVLQHYHNIRLFSEPLVPWQSGSKLNLNIKPGTVVDTQLTHPMQSEFYLNSHLAIKGTSRTPRYTILVDDSKFSMDIIESITFSLSFAHQIVYSPTSLPSPIYIALLYAKRGRALYSVYQSQKNSTDNIRKLDYEDLSNYLSYTNTTLFDQRVNA